MDRGGYRRKTLRGIAPRPTRRTDPAFLNGERGVKVGEWAFETRHSGKKLSGGLGACHHLIDQRGDQPSAGVEVTDVCSCEKAVAPITATARSLRPRKEVTQMPQDDAANESQIKWESWKNAMAPTNSGLPPTTPAYEDMQTWDRAQTDAYYNAGGQEP